jgi:hypothetical protein
MLMLIGVSKQGQRRKQRYLSLPWRKHSSYREFPISTWQREHSWPYQLTYPTAIIPMNHSLTGSRYLPGRFFRCWPVDHNVCEGGWTV